MEKISYYGLKPELSELRENLNIERGVDRKEHIAFGIRVANAVNLFVLCERLVSQK